MFSPFMSWRGVACGQFRFFIYAQGADGSLPGEGPVMVTGGRRNPQDFPTTDTAAAPFYTSDPHGCTQQTGKKLSRTACGQQRARVTAGHDAIGTRTRQPGPGLPARAALHVRHPVLRAATTPAVPALVAHGSRSLGRLGACTSAWDSSRPSSSNQWACAESLTSRCGPGY